MRFKLLTESKADEDRFREKIKNDEVADQFIDLKRRNIIKGQAADFTQYNNEAEVIKAIKNATSEYENRKSARGKDVLSTSIKNNTKYIYEDDKVQILQPLNFESSFYYGKATTWCTSGRYDGNCSPNSTEWDKLISRNERLIFVIDKSHKKEVVIYPNANNKREEDYHKYAIHYTDDSGYIIEVVDSITDSPLMALEVSSIFSDILTDDAIVELNKYCQIEDYIAIQQSRNLQDIALNTLKDITGTVISIKPNISLPSHNIVINTQEQDKFRQWLYQNIDVADSLKDNVVNTCIKEFEAIRRFNLFNLTELPDIFNTYDYWMQNATPNELLQVIDNISQEYDLKFEVEIKDYFDNYSKEQIDEILDLVCPEIIPCLQLTTDPDYLTNWQVTESSVDNNNLCILVELGFSSYIHELQENINNFVGRFYGKEVRILPTDFY